MEDNIVNDTREVAMVAAANVPDVTLPTYDQLYADFQQSKMLHTNALVREKILQENLAKAQELSFEDKLTKLVESIVENALDDFRQELSNEVESQIEDYMGGNDFEHAVVCTVRDMSFSVNVD